MIVQSSQYSMPPTDVRNLIAAKVSILDKYVIFNTGENEYSALIFNPNTNHCTQYNVFRQSGMGYNYTWQIQRIDDVEFEYTISNEYYVYSNDGVGQMLDLPIYEPIQTFVSLTMLSTLFFAIVFKGVLFKCLRRKS